MPYMKQTCIAGKTKEFTYYYTARYNKKGGSRKKNTNKTTEAQKKVNSRQAENKLKRVLNANFDGTCWYVTYSYKKENRPEGKEDLIDDINKLLRRLRNLFKKEGKILKYVWAAEVGERGAVHIHMVINNIDISKVKRIWEKGWITVKPLDENGQYRRLANYFVKYSEKTMKTMEGFSGKRYNSSKNLFIPEPEKKVVLGRNAYNHTITVPRGYYVDKDSIAEAWHDVTGYMYFTYTIIRDDRINIENDCFYNLETETGNIGIKEHHIRKKEREKKSEKLHSKRKEDTRRRSDAVWIGG